MWRASKVFNKRAKGDAYEKIARHHLQKQGLKTIVYEQADVPGGSTRSQELTLPGYIHDTGSAIHPMAVGSPFLKTLPLEDHGLQWVYPEIAFAHPFADGSAVAAYQDIERTAAQLGVDARNYQKTDHRPRSGPTRAIGRRSAWSASASGYGPRGSAHHGRCLRFFSAP